MNATKHTPGPWKVDPIWALIMGPHREEVAAVHSGCPERGRQNKHVATANAQLLATAPELLEAAELMWAFYKDLSNSNPGFLGKLCLQDYEQWIQATRKLPAAIAKAKGNQ